MYFIIIIIIIIIIIMTLLTCQADSSRGDSTLLIGTPNYLKYNLILILIQRSTKKKEICHLGGGNCQLNF